MEIKNEVNIFKGILNNKKMNNQKQSNKKQIRYNSRYKKNNYKRNRIEVKEKRIKNDSTKKKISTIIIDIKYVQTKGFLLK